jgi:hypothetical protein
MERLPQFVALAGTAPSERDARHFRTWQRISVQAQKDVRLLAFREFFAGDARAAADTDRAFTVAVYSACQPFYGRRPMDFTYDAGELSTFTEAVRSIGRCLQTRLAQITGTLTEPRLKRRFLPVWHQDILNMVKKKPRTLLEFLAREGSAIDALIELGTMRDERAMRRFHRNCLRAASVLGVPSEALEDTLLRAGIENLGDTGLFNDSDMFAPGSPDARIGADEDSDGWRAHGGRQMADAGVVADIEARG